MKNYLKTGFILFAICAICAALCAYVNSVTAPRIAANQAAANLEAAKAVSGGMIPGDLVSVSDIPGFDSAAYPAIKAVAVLTDDNGNIGGYQLELEGSGYGGSMTIIASYYSDGSLIGAKLTNNSETAGLGKKAENEWYMDMFKGKGADSAIPTSKNDLSESDAAAISGATITFTGVSSVIKQGSDYVKEGAR